MKARPPKGAMKQGSGDAGTTGSNRSRHKQGMGGELFVKRFMIEHGAKRVYVGALPPRMNSKRRDICAQHVSKVQ
jgi:hypothetical protein